MTYKYYIGIDCGVNTGIAIWEKGRKVFVLVGSLMIHEARERVKEFCVSYPGQVFVKVEDARQVRFGTDKFKAQGAGSVKRDAKIWEDFLSSLGEAYQMVRPTKLLTKIPAERFMVITGYKGKTNSHARDAAMLVYGM